MLSKSKKLYLLKNVNVIGIGIFIIIILLGPHALFSPDTKWQYKQLVGNVYSDWHPPIMAYFWKFLISIFRIKTILWYFHFIFFLIGSYLISEYLKKKSILISILFLILVFVFSYYGGTIKYIWKDTGTLSSYLFVIGVLINFKENDKLILKLFKGIICLVFIFYAQAIRSNVIFVSIPLICFVYYNFFENKIKCILITLLTWVIFIISINFISYNYLKAQKLYPVTYIMTSDIIQISKRLNKEIPNFLKTKYYEKEEFSEKYRNQPNINQYLVNSKNLNGKYKSMVKNSHYFYRFQLKKDKKIYQNNYINLKEYWLGLIRNHPILFLKIKLKYFIKLLCFIFFPLVILNFFIKLYESIKKKIEIKVLLIYLSSICYLYPYFIFNTSYDFRYIAYPLIVECTLFIIFLYDNLDDILKFLKKIKCKDLKIVEQLKSNK